LARLLEAHSIAFLSEVEPVCVKKTRQNENWNSVLIPSKPIKHSWQRADNIGPDSRDAHIASA
jgi:hypothetical protein